MEFWIKTEVFARFLDLNLTPSSETLIYQFSVARVFDRLQHFDRKVFQQVCGRIQQPRVEPAGGWLCQSMYFFFYF